MVRPIGLDAELISTVESLAALQGSDGGIDEDRHKMASSMLEGMTREGVRAAQYHGGAAYADALAADLQAWLVGGLQHPPDFSRSRAAVSPPADGQPFFFMGPLRLANGERQSCRFEVFISLREEPGEPEYLDIYRRYPHPLNICQSSHLLAGSAGLTRGNNIVFFPENIQPTAGADNQRCAVFFFNKFYRIYNELTLPLVRAASPLLAINNATEGDRRACYKARCVWGYLHDYFHHKGPRPFNTNIRAKTRWFTGLLEELKVDLQAYLACIEADFRDAETVAEFILLERLFRYPSERDWHRNFDSGTGLLLFRLLEEHEAVRIDDDGSLSFLLELVPEAARAFVAEVEALEGLPDEIYPSHALGLVRRYLPRGAGERRFERPATFAASRLAGLSAGPTLRFSQDDLRAAL